jgi:hypothetical protein
MRSILSISILLACVQASFAQPPETLWTRTYGGIEAERCWSVRQTSDGGYIVAGFTESFGAGDKDFYLVKTNSQSEPLWTRTYGGGYWDNAYSVQQTADGGYIVAGLKPRDAGLFGKLQMEATSWPDSPSLSVRATRISIW